MKITPLDIRRKEFKRSMRGYSDEEVDIFLDEVADEFERLFQENMELQDRAHRLDEQIAGHSQLKDALEKTLISAQLQAEELRANAHKESELILRDAELKARGVVSSSYAETQRTQQALVQLKLLEEDFRFKFRSLLEGYLRLLNEAPLAVTATDADGVAATAPEPQAIEASEVTSEPLASPEPVAPPQPAATSQPAAPPQPATSPEPSEPLEFAMAPEPAVPSEPVDAAGLVAPTQAPPAPPVPVMSPADAPAEELAWARVPPPVEEPSPAPGQVAPGGRERPGFLDEHWPAPLEEDTPTEESPPPVAEAEPPVMRPAPPEDGWIGGVVSAEEITAGSVPPPVAPPDDESQETETPRGFFFGRRMDDVDDTFIGEDVIKKDKTRDFEW